jgi:apolipoprotein N-acyltransferase
MDELAELSLAQSSHTTDLIVWPEAPAPFSWQDNHFRSVPRVWRFAPDIRFSPA